MGQLMGQREYARHRGCALRAVQKAIDAGRIKVVAGPDGKPKIDAEQADRDWVQNTDPAKQSLLYAASTASAPLAPLPGDEPAPPGAQAQAEDDPAAGQTEAYRQARAEREKVRLDRERLELEQLRGNLIDLGEAKRLAFSAFRELRDAVLNVPARIKDECAATSDALLVEQLIERELSKALASFDLARVTTDQDDADVDDE